MMAENVDSLVLEQLRLIREDLGALKTGMAAFKDEVHGEFGDVKAELLGQRTMIFSLATTIGHIDRRVEHIEEKLGIEQ
ncbi:MAG: hypothetical protein B7Z04_09110 [Rhodobacterales bacterium 32-66-9]|jgi:hypothetical protein|nr:MAG: hypothetical protein B7Z04_09110 [Rhodobacterales bacterium 32-66-9]